VNIVRKMVVRPHGSVAFEIRELAIR